MIEKISNEELEFVETLFYPPASAEILFSDYDNLTAMEADKLGHVRTGQLPLLSYEYLIDYDETLSEKDNFRLKKGAGDLFCLGGRLFGKTLFVEKIDSLISMALQGPERVGFSSYDAIHIRGVLEDVLNVLEHHPFFKQITANVTRSPNYRVSMKSGYLLESVNMNITGKKPGAQFFQKHFTRLYIEEASFETDQVYRQRRDSVSEDGCVFRIAGMTNFTKHSPCGRVFHDITKKPVVLNLPQYVNPKWDNNEKEKAIRDFNGEQSIGFRIFIKGDVVEEGISVFDMDRVRRNYVEEKKIKNFEINKENFYAFEEILVVERPKNATNAFITSDIGESAPSEIIVIFEVNETLKYVYNITLYNLSDKEQFKVFKFLGQTLQANFIGIDCTDGTGRAIFRSLEEIFPRENLVWVAFNEKIPIDFEKDEKNNIIFKNGEPVFKEEFITDWSVKHLKDLLYNTKMEIPIDYKFDQQFNSVVSMQSGNRTVYSCIIPENHLFQAFQVFSIAHWSNEFRLIKPIVKKPFCKAGV